MLDLVFFILSSYGLTQILCYGKVFDRWRPINGMAGELFSCSMCMGFWVGVFLSAFDSFTGLFSLSVTIADTFVLGLVSSGTSYLLDKMVGDEGIQVQKRW